jgi:protein phosphatase
MDPEVAIPDITRIEVEKGDRIFLCTDGVYKAMAPQILTARLQDNKKLENVVDVIKFMCEKFSTDNYSGILYEVM